MLRKYYIRPAPFNKGCVRLIVLVEPVNCGKVTVRSAWL